MARRSTLRASDADREQVADRLRRATAEGRLLAEELEERLGSVFAARTYAELDAVVADLPAPPPAGRRLARPSSPLAWVVAATVAIVALAVLLAVVAAMLFLVTGVLAGWLVWALLAWWLFGGRSRRSVHYSRRGRISRRVYF